MTGPDPRAVIAAAVHRAGHGTLGPVTADCYASAVLAALDAAGYVVAPALVEWAVDTGTPNRGITAAGAEDAARAALAEWRRVGYGRARLITRQAAGPWQPDPTGEAVDG